MDDNQNGQHKPKPFVVTVRKLAVRCLKPAAVALVLGQLQEI